MPVLCGPVVQKLPKWFLRALSALLRVAAAVLTTALLVGAAILTGVCLGALAGGSYSLGVVLAVAHSWAARKSISWSLLAGCLSWFYVLFYVCLYVLEKPARRRQEGSRK